MNSEQTPQPSNGFLARAVSIADCLDRRTGIAVVLACAVVFVIGSCLANGGGYLHPEVDSYLPYHLAPGSLLNKLFDSKVLDLDCYQARELSYLVDHIDFLFVALSTRAGFPHFLSLVHFAFSIAIGLLLWGFFTRRLGLGGLASLFLVLLLWTSPFFFLHWLFRSSKIGVSLAVTLLVIWIWHIERLVADGNDAQDSLLLRLGGFAAALAATCFDRQGVYFVAVGTLYVLVRYLDHRHKSYRAAFVILVSAIAVNTAYNLVLAPYLTFRLNGYRPNFRFQELPLPSRLGPWRKALANGFLLLVDTTRFLFGSVPRIMAVIAILAAAIVPMLRFPVRPALSAQAAAAPRAGWRLSRFLPAVLLASLVFMNLLMDLRHSALIWPDVKRTYYWMPSAVLLLVLAAFFLRAIMRTGPRARLLSLVVLACLLAGNLVALPAHNAIVKSGHLHRCVEVSRALKQALSAKPGQAIPDWVGEVDAYKALRQFGR